MRVVMLSDGSFARREHAMLRRVEVGLIDEGCRVVRVSPAGSPAEPTAGLAGTIQYDDAPWRRWALSPVKLIERQLEDVVGFGPRSETGATTVVHAWGDRCWRLAIELAGALGAEAALEVWSRAALETITAVERRRRGPMGRDLAAVWLAPDEAMLKEVKRRARRWPALATPWGVHAPTLTPREDSRPIESLCVLACASANRILLDVLTALARASAEPDRPMIFVDASAAAGRRDAWELAESLKLLPRLTFVPDMESRRDLILRSDVLINATGSGEHRSLILDAMAAGMIVIQRADPIIESASNPSLSFLVETPGAPAWEVAIRNVLSDPSAARSRGRSAAEYIRTHRPAHKHIRAILDAYALLQGDKPIPIRAETEKR